MLEKFLKLIIGKQLMDKLEINEYFMKRNISLINKAAILVSCVSIYWLGISLILNNTLSTISKIGVVVQLLASVVMLVLFYGNKKHSIDFCRIAFITYYAIIIAGVCVLICSRNYQLIQNNEVSNDMCIPISSFYMFIIAFIPMYEKIDSIIVVMLMNIGLLIPAVFFRASIYNLFSHIILAACFTASYVIFRSILIENIKHESTDAELNNKLMVHSYSDPLTGALNRRSMENYINYLISETDVAKIGVVFFDIDLFKSFNDFYGHTEGDRVLNKVTHLIEEFMLKKDNCYFFRYGGEEFVAILERADEKATKNFALDIKNTIFEANISRDDTELFDRITITAGAAVESIPNISGDYVSAANNQLYIGKSNKRNCCYFSGRIVGENSSYIFSMSSNINRNYLTSQILSDICNAVSDIYIVNRSNGKLSVLRQNGKAVSVDRILIDKLSYKETISNYIERNVHPLDKEMMNRKLDLENVINVIDSYDSFNIYYRVLKNDRTLYYKLNCIRESGVSENASHIIFAFMPEDIDLSKQQIKDITETDELTGVYTKQAFYNRAKKVIDEGIGKHFLVVISDIENFRMINRINGEVMGDEIINYMARSYSQIKQCRAIGRYGGDQFVMLFEDDGSFFDERFVKITDRIKDNAPVSYLNVKYGIYKDFGDEEPISVICDKAMLALKSIKHTASNAISIYDEELAKKQDRIQTYDSYFERALENMEFVVYYQPKFDAKTKKICASEALTRWITHSGEMISPGEFIPIFEANGKIARLDEYVFQEVCTHQKKLMNAEINVFPVSVNISRSSLFQPDVVSKYDAITEYYGVDKKLVPIEITESAAIDNDKIKELVEEFVNAGFSIHMDDFGSGYSSLSSLSMLPIDTVKLDKSLVDRIGNSSGDEILRHIVEIAHFMHMEVVAEGVEVETQYLFLRDLGVDMIQGYYFSRPVPFKEFENMLKKDL